MHGQQLPMKKLILAIALTFALAAGTVTVQPQSAMACTSSVCGTTTGESS